MSIVPSVTYQRLAGFLKIPAKAPSTSWWAEPMVQTDRAAFSERRDQESDRIVGSPRFGGAKKIHDKGWKDR